MIRERLRRDVVTAPRSKPLTFVGFAEWGDLPMGAELHAARC
jgi:hypothetical protein